MRRRLSLTGCAVVGLATLSVLSGCSSVDPAGSAGADVDQAVSNDEAPASLAFDSGGEPAGVLRLALPTVEDVDPLTVDPGDQSAVVVSDLLHDGLTESSAAGTLRPGVATTWSADEDFTIWTFTLDTDRVSQEEVLDSFARVRQSPSVAGRLLDGVTAIDPVGDDAVRFILRNPDAGFAWLVSGLRYSIVGAESEEEDGTTGRFVVESSDDDRMDLVDDRGFRIEVVWAPDGEQSYAALTLGQVDAAVVDPLLSRDSARRFGQQASARSIVRFYGLNTTSEDLWDSRVREAVLASVDRPGMLAELPAAGLAADGVAAASTAGFRIGSCDSTCVYDPVGARALLRDAGQWPTLTITYVGEDQADVAEVLADGLQRAGFGAELVEVTPEELARRIADGSAEIFAFGWAAPAGSLDAVVPPLFASYSSMNVTRLVAPEVDELVSQAAVTADDADRWELLAEAERAALAQWVLAPVAAAQSSLVQSPDYAPIATRADGSIDASSLG